MDSEERKQIFIKLLSELLLESDGKKNELAKKLDIKAPTLTGWFQGKVDPAKIDILVFERIAKVKNCSVDDLAKLLFLFGNEPQNQLDKLRKLITETLEDSSLEQLGRKLGISKNTIRGWINPSRSIDPGKLSAGTIAILAAEKKWTIEQLLTYLDLKKPVSEKHLISKVQSELSNFSLIGQIEILSWLSNLIEQTVKYSANLQTINKTQLDREYQVNDLEKNRETVRTLLMILEQEDKRDRDADLNLAQRATNYATNIAVNLELQPDNIQVASIKNLPESLEEFDLLLFDISSSESEAIALIEEIEFDGNMIVFAPDDLPSEVMANLSARVSDVVIKPIDWSSLKDKEYFR